MTIRKIREVIQNQKILTAPADITVRDAAMRMTALHVGAIMVTAGDQLAGIFTERDVLKRVVAAGLNPDTTLVEQVMTANPQTACADSALSHALHMMFDGGFRHVPVVEAGRPIGMVSARDALGPELVQFEGELQRREDITELL